MIIPLLEIGGGQRLRHRDKFPPGAAPDGRPRAAATQAIGEEKSARGLVCYMATVYFARNLARSLLLFLAHLPDGVAWEAGLSVPQRFLHGTVLPQP